MLDVKFFIFFNPKSKILNPKLISEVFIMLTEVSELSKKLHEFQDKLQALRGYL